MPLDSCYIKEALDHLRSSDPRLCAVIDRIGPYRNEFDSPVFASLARSIVYQQLNGKAASTIFGRLQAAMPDQHVTPAGVLSLRPDELRALGLSNQKSTYLRSLSEKTLDKTIDFDRLPELPDEEVIAHLTQVKGIGVWTAQMFLMFALRRPDVMLLGDLGIRTAIHRLYKMRKPPSPERMAKTAKPWHPHASVACWYLWRSLDSPPEV